MGLFRHLLILDLLGLILGLHAGAPAPVCAQPDSTEQALARVAAAKNPSWPHAFDVEIKASRPVDLAAVRIKQDKDVWGRFSLIIDPPQTEVSFQTASFRFLPASYEVEVEVDCGGPTATRTFGPYSNPIQKMIIMDRDANPQRGLLIEGDAWFLFGRLAASSEVSTGLLKNGGTPLGYYHVRKKEPFAVNAKEEWDMPLAQWYTPESYPEGVNGLHEGFEGTIYGIRQSHGCTRMPSWFAKELWAWSDIETPVIFIGNEFQTSYDRGRFNPEDYRFFQALIRDTFLYHQSLLAGQEAPTCFSQEQAELVSRMKPFQDDLLEACAQYRRFSKGEAFGQIVEQLVALRGSG